MAERNRDVDVVVLGATGVTGRRVAAYLAERASAVGARWAPAGRDAGRVGERLRDLGVSAPPQTLVADVSDPASLRELAAGTRVVLNAVGPYTLYAEPVIDACIAEGAHYVDLTGEVGFVRDMIERHHDRAREAGVKVVQVCGFEALPPDLATLRAAELAPDGEDLREVEALVSTRAPSGVGSADFLSGGTIQSFGAVLTDPHAAQIVDPALLVTDPERAARVRQVSPLRIAPRVGPHGEAVAPMMPAPVINPPVIQRTFALLAEEGEDQPVFSYREGLTIPGSRVTLAPRLALAGMLSGLAAGTSLLARAPSAARRAAAAAIARAPGSGFGPTRRLEEWSWRLELRATTSGGSEVEVDVEGDGHPGYLTTATAMGEVGLLLADEGATPDRAGCLTPATALGTGSFQRLAAAGLRFSP